MAALLRQLAFTVVSFIGLWGILAVLGHSRRLTRHHRFFRFQRTERLDMVLTNLRICRREVTEQSISPRRPRRSETSRAPRRSRKPSAIALRARPITVAVSAELESRLNGDLVVLGLPGKNPTSDLVLSHLSDAHPELGLIIMETDRERCGMSLGGVFAPYAVEYQPGTEIPVNDFASRRPVGQSFGRAQAAADPLRRLHGVQHSGGRGLLPRGDVLNVRYRALRKQHPVSSTLWSPPLAMFRHAHRNPGLISDQVVEVVERAFVPAPGPRAAPCSSRPPRAETNGVERGTRGICV